MAKLTYKDYLNIALILTVIGLFSVVLQGPRQALGSIETGQFYQATSTARLAAGFNVLKTGPTELGSLLVSSSSATTIVIWNATSTTDVASSTFATFKAGVGEDEYVIDASLDRGLIVQIPSGFNGSGAVTWK